MNQSLTYSPQELRPKQMRYMVRAIHLLLKEGRNVFGALLSKYATPDSNAYLWRECYTYRPAHLVTTATWVMIKGKIRLAMKVPASNFEAMAAGLFLALSYNLECLGRHGVHMYDLLERGKAGDDKAIATAMQIDPAITGFDFVQKRINELQLRGESLDNHYNSFNRYKLHTKTGWLFINVLEENKQLETFSDEKLTNLFVDSNILYPHHGNYDIVRKIKAKALKAIRNQNPYSGVHT